MVVLLHEEMREFERIQRNVAIIHYRLYQMFGATENIEVLGDVIDDMQALRLHIQEKVDQDFDKMCKDTAESTRIMLETGFALVDALNEAKQQGREEAIKGNQS